MDYRDLVVWQKSMSLAEVVYRETALFPADERYGLTARPSSLRRSGTCSEWPNKIEAPLATL